MRFFSFLLQHWRSILALYSNWWQVVIHLQRFIFVREYVALLRIGSKFVVRSGVEDIMVLNEVFYEKVYDKPHYNCQVRPGDTVVDIGGYIGDFAVYAAKAAGPQGTVVSFEPLPELFALLKRNLKLNNLQNVEAVNKGVGKIHKQATFYSNKKFAGAGSSLFSELQSEVSQSVTIEIEDAKILSTYLNGRHCDVLKLDAEGAEFEILPRLTDSFIRHCRCMMIEYHRLEEHSLDQEQLIALLKEYGYKVVHEPHSTEKNIGMLYASRDVPSS